MKIKSIRQLPVEVRGGSVRKQAVVELDGRLEAGRYRSPYARIDYMDGLPTAGGSDCMLLLCEEGGYVLDFEPLHEVFGLDYGESYAAMLEWLEKLEGSCK